MGILPIFLCSTSKRLRGSFPSWRIESWIAPTWILCWKWVVGINRLFHLLTSGLYWGYNPLILTIDPNSKLDIQGTIFWKAINDCLRNICKAKPLHLARKLHLDLKFPSHLPREGSLRVGIWKNLGTTSPHSSQQQDCEPSFCRESYKKSFCGGYPLIN